MTRFFSRFLLLLLLGACAQTMPGDFARTSLEGEQVPQQFTAGPSDEVTAGWPASFEDGRLAEQAGALLKPSIGAAAQASTGGAMGVADLGSNYGAGLNMSWELDLWGRLRAATSAAEAAYQASELDFIAAQQSLIAQLAKSWFFAIEAQQQETLAGEVVQLQQQLVDTVAEMAAVGKVPERDVLLARAELSSARERLRQTRAARENGVRALEVMLGRYPSAELALAVDLPKMPATPPAGLPAELLQRRPDLRAAEQRVAVAFNLKESARAARLPKIGLNLGGGAASGDLTNLLGGDKAFWNAGANFLAPLYTGGALKAQVEIETARQEQALAAYGGLALRAFGEVENTLSNEVLMAERAAFIDAAVADFRKVYELTEEEYKVGKITLFNLLQAQLRLVSSRVAQTRIQGDRLAERVNLFLALGGDFEAPN